MENEEVPAARQARRDRHWTVWVTDDLDRRVMRRIRSLPHEPSKSAWVQLVIKRELDRLEEAARLAATKPLEVPAQAD